MRNKKLNKILSICFVLILAGAALVGGTLASSAEGITINEDGTITVGSQVVLVQEQRNTDGFIPYDGEKTLVPIVGELRVGDDGYPVNQNFVDRFVTVKNNSDKAVYTRVLVAMPVAFDTEINGVKPINIVFGTNDAWEAPTLIAEEVICGNTLSNIYSVEYEQLLAPGAKASGYAMYGVYISSEVSNKGNHYTFAGQEIDYDIFKGLDLKVMAQAIQKEGLDRTTAMSMMRTNPWATGNNTSTSNSGDIQ